MRDIRSPKDMPHARHQLAVMYETGPRQDETAARMSQHLGFRVHPEELRIAHERHAHHTRLADLFWATPAMTELAIDASQDLPAWSFHAAMPSRSGMLMWAGMLPPIRWQIPLPDALDDQIAPCAVTWSPAPDGIALSLLARAADIARLSPGLALDTLAPLMPFWTMTIPHRQDGDFPQPDPGARREWPEWHGVLSLIGATWILMQEPKVVDRRTIEPARRDAMAAERAGGSRPLVTTVDLRALRTAPRDSADSDDPGRRRLGHRHVVRGHWRQQYYASADEHRPKWIHSYLKGDPSLPLLVTEKVMVWRR